MKKYIAIIGCLLFGLFAMAQVEETNTALGDNIVEEVRSYYDTLSSDGREHDYFWNYGFVVLNELEKWNNGQPIISKLSRWNWEWKLIHRSIIESNNNHSIDIPSLQELDSVNNLDYQGVSTIGLALFNIEGDYLSDC